jgi:hypothetical protein
MFSNGEERRREQRLRLPGLVAHYWNGDSPRAREVLDISATGSYLQTDERWYPGTVVRVTLQSRLAGNEVAVYVGRDNREANAGAAGPNGSALLDEHTQTLVLLAQMVRHGPDGVGLQFIFPEKADAHVLRFYPDCTTDRKALTQFLKQAEGNHRPVTFSID